MGVDIGRYDLSYEMLLLNKSNSTGRKSESRKNIGTVNEGYMSLLRVAKGINNEVGFNSISFNVRLGKQKYDISITGKITVVEDLSNTGKTLLWSVLRGFPRNRASVYSNLPVIAVDKLTDITEADAIYVLDESAECLQESYIGLLQKRMKNGLGYFLLLVRDTVLNEVAYSVDDIKVFVNVQGIRRLKNKYPVLYKLGIPKCDRYFIEDSTTGLEFFAKIFNNVSTLSGKNNWVNVFDGSTEKTALIIDRCGFGSSMSRFYSMFMSHGNNIWVCDYDSFEEFVLRTLNVGIGDVTFCANREKAYETMLKEVLPQYGKSAGCLCLTHCTRCSKCEYHDELMNAKKFFKKSYLYEYMEV